MEEGVRPVQGEHGRAGAGGYEHVPTGQFDPQAAPAGDPAQQVFGHGGPQRDLGDAGDVGPAPGVDGDRPLVDGSEGLLGHGRGTSSWPGAGRRDGVGRGISMSIVDQLHDQTLKMAAEITANPQSDTLVEDFDAFLIERDELMRDIQHELTDQEKEKIKEIIQTDQQMAKQLTVIQNGIKADIQAIQKKKTKQLNYQNPYQPMTSDGVYYDKRK